MKPCPYCGYSNYEYARVCRKCEVSLAPAAGTVFTGKTYMVGPERARLLRRRGLLLVLLGLLMKVYWGGYGHWPTLDFPQFAAIRFWLEPVLVIGGMVLYVLGCVLRSV